MANSVWRRWIVSALPCLLMACAAPPPVVHTTDRILLLPQADGSPSAIVVRLAGGDEALLAQPYAMAAVSAGSMETSLSSAANVRARYGVLYDAMPPGRRSFVVYFETGGDRLTVESAQRLDDILREVATMPAPEVLVVGHADALGTDSLNDELSMQRARIVRAGLIYKGIDSTRVEAVGRGKRELLVPTRDGVAESRNRRVEIQVR